MFTRSWPIIYIYIYIIWLAAPCDEVNAGRCVSRVARYARSLYLSLCLSGPKSRHAHAHAQLNSRLTQLEQVELVCSSNSIKLDSINKNAFKLVSGDDDDICKNITHLNNTSYMYTYMEKLLAGLARVSGSVSYAGTSRSFNYV